MKPNFKTFYAEARRNPEQNPKRDAYIEILSAYNRLGVKRMTQVGLSMTHVDKLGINPRSTYDTPIGIYAYPFDWAAEEAQEKRSFKDVLPFEEKAPFVNLFTWKPTANILELNSIEKSEFDSYVSKIKGAIAKLDPATKNASLVVDRWVEDSKNSARVDTFGGRLWYVTYRAKSHLAEGREYELGYEEGEDLGWDAEDEGQSGSWHDFELANMWQAAFKTKKTSSDVEKLSDNQKNQLHKKLSKILNKDKETRWSKKGTAQGEPVLWNKLFREIGVDGAVDYGDGIIHGSEKHQMVIFNPRIITKVERVDNISRRVRTATSGAGYKLFERLIALMRAGQITQRNAKEIISTIEYETHSLDFSKEALDKYDYSHLLNSAMIEALKRSATDAHREHHSNWSAEPVRKVIESFYKAFGHVNQELLMEFFFDRRRNPFIYPVIQFMNLSDEETNLAVKVFIRTLLKPNVGVDLEKDAILKMFNDVSSYKNVQSANILDDETIKSRLVELK